MAGETLALPKGDSHNWDNVTVGCRRNTAANHMGE